jgi:hypothetical protein
MHKTLLKIVLKIQNDRKFQYGRFFGSKIAEWNVLVILYIENNLLLVVEIQNGG